jgi:hypothetical protein
VRLKSLIDVLFCKLHYGFGGNRLPTLSKQVSFLEFIFDRYDFGIKFYIICSSSADLFVPLFAGMSASLAVKGSRSI